MSYNMFRIYRCVQSSNGQTVLPIRLYSRDGPFSKVHQTQISLASPLIEPFDPAKPSSILANYHDNLNLLKSKPEANCLVIHGSAGKWKQYAPMAESLAEKNIRLVVPILPTYETTRFLKFKLSSSPSHRSVFVKNFTQKLGLKTIDCLIGHSLGNHTLFQLWLDNAIQFKSMAILHPIAWNPTPLPFRPGPVFEYLASRMHKTWFHRFAYNVVSKSGAVITWFIYPQCRLRLYMSIWDLIDSSHSWVDRDHGQINAIKKKLATDDRPRLIFCANDDWYQSADMNSDSINILSNSDVIHENIISKDGLLIESKMKNSKNVRVIKSTIGNHLAFRKYNEISVEEILRLIKRSKSSS